MSERTYYGTKRVLVVGGAYLVHFDKWWEFEKGDVVDVTVRSIDGEGRDIRAVKKVSIIGNSKTIFFEKAWGFVPGDVVVISITRNVRNNDPRSKAEEIDKELSE